MLFGKDLALLGKRIGVFMILSLFFSITAKTNFCDPIFISTKEIQEDTSETVDSKVQTNKPTHKSMNRTKYYTLKKKYLILSSSFITDFSIEI